MIHIKTKEAKKKSVDWEIASIFLDLALMFIGMIGLIFTGHAKKEQHREGDAT